MLKQENYSGEVPIEKTKEYKYLGFIISCVGDNMANIKAIKDKSIGVIRTIMHKLEALNLERYYFECAMIFMNVMLRGSILYASETYYNLTENQLRSIERIEEGFLRKILKTTKGCPIVQLYLETGQWPARFAIQKSRLLFLKTILAEDEQSMVSKFFYLQLQRPSRGDWASTCLKDLKNLKILNTLEEIKIMPKRTFLNLLQKSIRENALIYLLKKMGSKGSEMVYDSLEMADYLLPYNDRLKIEEKQTMFKIRNRMVEIGNNFGKKEDCFCGVKETMSHIYTCEFLNDEKSDNAYENIHTGNLSEQIEVFKRFEINIKRRNQIRLIRDEQNETPCDQSNDPLDCKQYSIG